MKNFPSNYLSHFNRIYGAVELSPTRLLLYTHFTNIIVDMEAKIPEFCKISKNHPSKTDTRVMNWNETLAYHHKKYMSLLSHAYQTSERPQTSREEVKTDNFKIDNRFKGILGMERLADGTMVVVENLWKNLVARLPDVLKVHKFGQ
uniref:Uncharacterized protein n=2 Tax=Euplotes harpa TaxID=151035 RepID=A0A7S3NBF1_9SPIT|mmetsp:Transcript_32835/g.37591  ORF Transcript_32835/g.37591 Transcript_32835/m.37591 type:complete len:147 (+) Transcript_32835:1842-2282(+)